MSASAKGVMTSQMIVFKFMKIMIIRAESHPFFFSYFTYLVEFFMTLCSRLMWKSVTE